MRYEMNKVAAAYKEALSLTDPKANKLTMLKALGSRLSDKGVQTAKALSKSMGKTRPSWAGAARV